MKILIVDDEPLARERLRSLIEELAVGEVVAEAGNGQQALDFCQQQQPDVVLLDIRMPVLDGIATATELARCDQPPAVIFTTAYDEYALQAFDSHAVDYLVKPIRRERLAEALQHATRLSQAQLQAISPQQTDNHRTHIRARSGGKLQLIPIESIHCLHAEHKYVTVSHDGGEVLIEESLKSLEEALDNNFMRIHRNAIINIQYLDHLEKDASGQWLVCLRGSQKKLEVSRRHLPGVRKRINELGA